MSNGGPATRRDVRQAAGFDEYRQPARVGRIAALAYMDPERRAHVRASAHRRPGHLVEARASAIEDARVDCRSTVLRNYANLTR